MKTLPKPTTITPELIASTLFHYHNVAHFFHLQTTSFAKHKMLDELYNALVEHKDSICEYLLGVQAPKRFTTLASMQVPSYSDGALAAFIDEGFNFSIQICIYAESKNLEQLCNLASELQGSFVKAKLFLTYQ
jgi:hypothetical protein